MNQFNNIFSVDLEDWYHSFYTGKSIKTTEYRVVKPTEEILRLLKQTKNKATFFVVGDIAQKHPALIKEIFKQGHEIACHSLHHHFVYHQTQKQFINDLRLAKNIIEETIHHRIIGYRAPAWSVNPQKNSWFWQVLHQEGFLYSSSLFPFSTFLYGDSRAPQFSHTIDTIQEIPPSTYQFGPQRIPFSGGFYLRLMPIFGVKMFTRLINQQHQPVIFYIHPREIDPMQPRVKLPLNEYFIHYYNLDHTFDKLKSLLHSFKTTSFQQYYQFKS